MTDISNNNINYEDEEEVNEEEIEDGLYENDSSCGSEETTEKKSTLSSSGFKQFVSSKQPFYKMSLKIGSYSEPRSFLEKLTDVGSYMDIFLKAPKIESEENRFLEILKFYISQWIQKKDAKSPFNPVLGEIFQCKWNHSDDSTTEYFAEQISHHPPISSFCMYNQKNSVIFHSTLSPTSKMYPNSFESSMEGKLVFELPTRDEIYVVDAPKIVAKGIFVGTLTAEATGSTVLRCEKTGYYAEIDFKGKGIFNKQVSLVVKVKHVSSKKNLYTLEGRFDGIVSITSMKTNKTVPFFDVNSDSLQPIIPSEEQLEENNSRIVWKHVISNLLEGCQDEAQKQKVIVEEHQRALAKQREGKAWVPKHFIKNQDGVTSDDDDNNIFYQFLKLNDIKKEIEKNK